jgi:hypothetical protein
LGWRNLETGLGEMLQYESSVDAFPLSGYRSFKHWSRGRSQVNETVVEHDLGDSCWRIPRGKFPNLKLIE